MIDAAGSAALIGAGLLSVVLFPASALALLGRTERDDAVPTAADDVALMAM